jgi:hypothetical protein
MKQQVFHVDTNLLNARQKIEEMNELEKMHDKEQITLVWSETSQNEALNNSSELLKKKANTHIYTINDGDEYTQTAIELDIFKIMEIENNSSLNDINDAKIVCEAHKYGAILITNDGASKSQAKGILGRREELQKYVQVVTPSEALEIARKCAK